MLKTDLIRCCTTDKR